MTEYLLELKNITKKFSSVLANDNISMNIRQGEIHAIVGENGAGKSTLMNILYGLHRPSSGQILYRGRPVEFSSPLDAIDLGIGMVHQHFMLLKSFRIWENIMLGIEPRKKRFFIDEAEGIRQVEAISKQYGLEVDPRARLETVSVGIQQRVEILKALYKGADILILDEPTAVLTPQESRELFQVIRGLVRDQGKTIIIITHKLGEVMEISDRVSVMRQGRIIDTVDTARVNERILSEMMVGREVLLDELERLDLDQAGEILTARGLYARNNRDIMALRGLDLDLRPGEILGLAGIEGNGQSELVEVLTGMRELQAGEISVGGQVLKEINPKIMREAGLAHIPEDRLAMGLSSQASLADNLLMGSQRKPEFMGPLSYSRRKNIDSQARKLIGKYDIRTPSERTLLGNLSGGNMQKLVVAREFEFRTPILIIAQPTRGVDIGAIEFIHREIIRRRNEGVAILLVSAELDEIFRLADRILTIYEGRISGEFRPDEISKSEIGLYMTGKTKEGLR